VIAHATVPPNAAAVRSDGLIATYEFGHLPNQETWAHTLVDGGLAWHGDRIYAITEQLSEPDNVTLRIRDLDQ
jgi:hypothetical protein